MSTNTVRPLLSGHPRDFVFSSHSVEVSCLIEVEYKINKLIGTLKRGWPLDRWPLNRGRTVPELKQVVSSCLLK